MAEDNRRLEALTRPFPTYSLSLSVNDSLSRNQVEEINKELRRHFAFLRSKKYLHKRAACEIRVSVHGEVVGALEYTTSPKTDAARATVYYAHAYVLNHRSSAELSVYAQGKALATIPIDSNALIERRYSFTEVKDDYSWMKDRTVASVYMTRDVQAAMLHHSKAAEVWSFNKDFFDLFKNYLSR